jgi:hypothetical protein
MHPCGLAFSLLRFREKVFSRCVTNQQPKRVVPMEAIDRENKPFLHVKDALVFGATIAILSLLLLAQAYISKNAVLLHSARLSHRSNAEVGVAKDRSRAFQFTSTTQHLGCRQRRPETGPVFGREVADIEKHKENTSVGKGKASAKLAKERIPFAEIINRAAGRYQVDRHLIRAIIFAESGYNPKAKSKKGALGLMQLMPSTAQALGVQDVLDPEENIDGGVRYFKTLLDRFDGDVQLALAAYNAGSRHVRNYEGVPPFRATQLYIKKVLEFQQKFKAEMKTGPEKIA